MSKEFIPQPTEVEPDPEMVKIYANNLLAKRCGELEAEFTRLVNLDETPELARVEIEKQVQEVRKEIRLNKVARKNILGF